MFGIAVLTGKLHKNYSRWIEQDKLTDMWKMASNILNRDAKALLLRVDITKVNIE